MTHNFLRKKEIKNIKSRYEILPMSQKKRERKGKEILYRKDVPPTNDVTPRGGVYAAKNLRLTNNNDIRHTELLPEGPNIFDDSDNRCTCKAPEIDISRNGNVNNENKHNTFGQFDNLDPLFDFILYDGYTEYDILFL